MKSVAIYLLLSILLGLPIFGYAIAGIEFKLFGTIRKIEMASPDGVFSATVTIKETTTDKIIIITVTDTMTLDKLRDHRIVEGDDIRCIYETNGIKNISHVLKKTAGC